MICPIYLGMAFPSHPHPSLSHQCPLSHLFDSVYLIHLCKGLLWCAMQIVCPRGPSGKLPTMVRTVYHYFRVSSLVIDMPRIYLPIYQLTCNTTIIYGPHVATSLQGGRGGKRVYHLHIFWFLSISTYLPSSPIYLSATSLTDLYHLYLWLIPIDT